MVVDVGVLQRYKYYKMNTLQSMYPTELYSVSPVSYTHLDVYKRQLV